MEMKVEMTSASLVDLVNCADKVDYIDDILEVNADQELVDDVLDLEAAALNILPAVCVTVEQEVVEES